LPASCTTSGLEGWMYRIAQSAIVDHYRRAAIRRA
jgi:DNA-directed RNA polymerase specialized sigma24 family protein